MMSQNLLSKVIVGVSLVVSVGLIGFALSVEPKGKSDVQKVANSASEKVEVVREEGGVQYVRVLAQGGYSPSFVQAKAGMATVIEVETRGTYDCSASLVVPQLDYQKFLPATGVTKIEVAADDAVGIVDLVCSMGMYSAQVVFEG